MRLFDDLRMFVEQVKRAFGAHQGRLKVRDQFAQRAQRGVELSQIRHHDQQAAEREYAAPDVHDTDPQSGGCACSGRHADEELEAALIQRRTDLCCQSPGGMAQDSRKTYTPPARPALNQWGLGGSWNIGAESATLKSAPGKIVFRFHSRDLHIVLGPQTNGTPVRFNVKLNGAAPGADHGSDSTADGAGEVREPRMYQLIRQKGSIKDALFELEFLDPGVQAFSFTFG